MKTLLVSAYNCTILIPFTVNENVNIFDMFTPLALIHAATSFTSHTSSYKYCSIVEMISSTEYHMQPALQWCHNGHHSVPNHQPHDCLRNDLLRRGSKKTSKLRVTGLCAGNSPETREFPAQMASNAENVSIWWRHHVNTISTTWLVITIPDTHCHVLAHRKEGTMCAYFIIYNKISDKV